MKNVKDHYEYYMKDTDFRLNSLKNQIKELVQRNSSSAHHLNKFRHYWYFEHNLKKTRLTEITLSDLPPDEVVSGDPLLLRLKGYLMNKEVIKVKREIEKKLKDSIIPYHTFRILMETTFKTVRKMCIEEGFIFHSPYSLHIGVVAWYIRKNPPLDKKATFDKRNQIIENGGIPYNKETAPDGEQFTVLHDPVAYYFRMLMPFGFPNRRYYTTRVVKGTYSMASEVYNHARKIGKDASFELYEEMNNIDKENDYVFSQSEKDYLRF